MAAEATGLFFEKASGRYIRCWNRLVSATNWEKGRIVSEWRTAMLTAGLSATTYSDEAWCRRVGSVSSQHVGRLRRVHKRFGTIRRNYRRLCWSHFQAAVDWNDAEMWLEGAEQNRWSIAAMRGQRWKALGVNSGLVLEDDDFFPGTFHNLGPPIPSEATSLITPSVAEVRDPSSPQQRLRIGSPNQAASPDSVDLFDPRGKPTVASQGTSSQKHCDWPTDLEEAWEALRLSILKHKLAGWQEVSPKDVSARLTKLQELVLAS